LSYKWERSNPEKGKFGIGQSDKGRQKKKKKKAMRLRYLWLHAEEEGCSPVIHGGPLRSRTEGRSVKREGKEGVR